jgi:hypothetical protein
MGGGGDRRGTATEAGLSSNVDKALLERAREG